MQLSRLMKNGFPLTLRQAQHERKSARPELVEGFFISLLGPGDEIADTGLVEVGPQPSPGSGRDRRGVGRLAVDESSPSRTVAVSDLPPPPGPPTALRGPLDVEIVPTLAPTSGSVLDGESGVGGAGPPLRRTRTADQILE